MARTHSRFEIRDSGIRALGLCASLRSGISNLESRIPRFGAWVLIVSATLATGCEMVPKTRVEDCHKLAQSLQADNSRLKDVAMKRQNEVQDLTQRSIDDARKIKELAESNQRMEQSLSALQEDRERLSAVVDRITGQARAIGLDPDAAPRRAGTDPNDDAPRSARRSGP